MSDQMKQDVFVSFSFKDQETAEKIVNLLLNKYHITYWICTRDIRAGEHYKRTIVDAIKSSSIFLFIQSKHSVVSEEVPKEVSLALAKRKTIIPFVIDECDLEGDLEYDLLTVQRVDATKPTLEDRVEDLARQIYTALGRSFESIEGLPTFTNAEQLMSTPTVIPKSIFYGREDVLEKIHTNFTNGERVQFLHGIGGIGKTQIAKQYAKRYKDDFDIIIYATYNGSLKELFITDTPFEIRPSLSRLTLSNGEKENDDMFFERKLAKFKSLANARTLIILDNFDTERDADLEAFLDGNYRLLITTRSDYSRLYPTIPIQTLESMESLIHIFMANYDGYDVEADDPDLVTLIELVNRHTYTVELLAQHMENSGQTAKEMVEALQKEGIFSLNEKVQEQGGQTQIAYENLLKMFKVFHLSEEDKDVLRYLSLMPLSGVDVRKFREWADLPNTKIIRDLETRSWLSKNIGGIALHPIIKEVIRHEIPANTKNCKDFLERFLDNIVGAKSWNYCMAEKEFYASIAEGLLAAFPEINEDTLLLYDRAETLFSFSVRPKVAATLAGRLIHYFKEIDETSYDYAYWTFKMGWLYHFNMHLDNALPNAKDYLERAYLLFEKQEIDGPDKGGFFSQLMGNLAKVYARLEDGNRTENLEKALFYAQKSVDTALEYLKPGDAAYIKVAGAYIQLAEIYTATQNYDDAAEYFDKAYDIICPIFGEQGSDYLYVLSGKAILAYEQGEYEKVIPLLEKILDGYALIYNELYYGRYERLLLLLKCHLALGHTKEACEVYEKLDKIATGIFAPGAKQLVELESLRP